MNKTDKTGSVTDAALTRSLTLSVISIILCMVCLTGTTWAWYSSSLTSGENVIVGPYFEVEVTVDGAAKSDADGVYSFAGGTHKVKLSGKGTASNGFCQLIATELDSPAGTTYYAANLSESSVELDVTGSGTLKITPMIGKAPTGNGIPEDGIKLLPDRPKPEDEPTYPTGGFTPDDINNKTEPETPEETPAPIADEPIAQLSVKHPDSIKEERSMKTGQAFLPAKYTGGGIAALQ